MMRAAMKCNSPGCTLTAKPDFFGFARILFASVCVSLETGRLPLGHDKENAFSAG